MPPEGTIFPALEISHSEDFGLSDQSRMGYSMALILLKLPSNTVRAPTARCGGSKPKEW